MKNQIMRFLGATAMLVLVSGCADDPEASRVLGKTLGASVGAVAGGYLGNKIGDGTVNTIATTVGVAMGGYFGAKLIDRLTSADLSLAAATQSVALEQAPSGEPVTWSNPDTGASGAATARPAYNKDGVSPCRSFTQLFNDKGERFSVEGVACRNPDGSWRVLKTT